jgi:hypothetical protein
MATALDYGAVTPTSTYEDTGFLTLNGKKMSEEEFNRRTSKVKELTVAEIGELLGYEVKVAK